MHFGLYTPCYGEYADPRRMSELARQAEAAGWDGLFISDHLQWLSLAPQAVGDPWILLAAMAMSTQRIRIGILVTPLARRRPWQVAREAVTLDHLSGGRMILGAGGAGFIGSHLCAALLAAGHTVIALDSYITGHPRNIAPLTGHPRFQVIEHDIIRPLPVTLPAAGAIFHLASPASPADFSRIPLQIQLTNSLGTYHLLEHARRTGARFLFTSTSEAYGDPEVHPQVETYFGNVNSVGPRACYDEGKRFGESLVMTYVREYGVDGRLVRIFNTYGPHMNPADGRVPPNFISQALTGRPITIYGDGRQTRSFCYVEDLVAGLRAVMDAPHERVGGQVCNVGNPDERTILEFAHLVRMLSGSTAPIEHRPALAEDPARRCPDITRIRTATGWAPRVSLEQGLRRTIAWFRTVVPGALPAQAPRAGQEAEPLAVS